MTTENNVGLGNMYNDNETNAPTTSRNLILTEIPVEENQLVMKFVPDLSRGKINGRYDEYWEIKEHGHISGIDTKTNKPIISLHPCQRTLGAKSCPECDRYFELLKQVKEAGGKETEKGKSYQRAIEILKPRKKGWILYVTQDSDVIKAYKAPESVINMLWGKAKSAYYPEIPSLIADMRSQSMSPFDLRNNTMGWISIHKTGEGLGTRYFVQIASKTVPKIVNGRPVGTSSEYISATVSDYILNSYDLSNLPDVRKFESTYAFTMEESIEFAKNPLITPQRVVDQFKRTPRKQEDAHESDETQSTAVESVMAIITSGSNATLSDIDQTL
jgi:hypothetical protein